MGVKLNWTLVWTASKAIWKAWKRTLGRLMMVVRWTSCIRREHLAWGFERRKPQARLWWDGAASTCQCEGIECQLVCLQQRDGRKHILSRCCDASGTKRGKMQPARLRMLSSPLPTLFYRLGTEGKHFGEKFKRSSTCDVRFWRQS